MARKIEQKINPHLRIKSKGVVSLLPIVFWTWSIYFRVKFDLNVNKKLTNHINSSWFKKKIDEKYFLIIPSICKVGEEENEEVRDGRNADGKIVESGVVVPNDV